MGGALGIARWPGSLGLEKRVGMPDVWGLGAENFGGQGGFENFTCQVPSLTVNNGILCEPNFPAEGASWEGVRGSGIWFAQYVLSESMVCKGNAQTRQTRSVFRSAMPTLFSGGVGSWPARGRRAVPQG